MTVSYIVPKGVTGVYGLRHNPSGLVYIGSSGYCIYNRFRHHFVKLRQGRHATPKLQALWNESKPGDFEQVLFELCPADVCKEREQYYMSLHRDLLLNGSPDAARKRWAKPEYRAAVTEAARVSATERHRNRTFGRHSWSPESHESWKRKMGYA